jgi:hypothetical protein
MSASQSNQHAPRWIKTIGSEYADPKHVRVRRCSE